MYKGLKIIFPLMTAILLAGCRTAKPTNVYEAASDSLTTYMDSAFSSRRDSISVSTESMNRVNKSINFVDGGGCISVLPDGSVVLSGVANLKSSKQNASVSRTESQYHELQNHMKDSITAAHAKANFEESGQTTKSGSRRNRLGIGFALITLLIIAMVIAKIRRNKF